MTEQWDWTKLGADSHKALAAIITLQPGWYSRSDLAFLMHGTTGITKEWATELLRLIAVHITDRRQSTIKVGRRNVKRSLVLIDPVAIKATIPGIEHIDPVGLHLVPTETA